MTFSIRCLVLLCLLMPVRVSAENTDTLYFRQAEDTLVAMAGRIIEPADDYGRLKMNEAFYVFFEKVLLREGSFRYPFDSLGTVSLLFSPDRRFRVITWYVPLSGQQFKYFGFIQTAGCGLLEKALFALEDATGSVCWRQDQELYEDQWYGAFYYELIHHQHAGDDLYTLLGWKGDNPLTRKRVIEPLVFEGGRPVFGRSIFGRPYGEGWRVVFEYSARVSMSLLYEHDFYHTGDSLVPMIVFDRLAPASENLVGHRQFYKPEVNIFDGMYFDKGRWVFVEDVDARMPRTGD